MDKLQWLEVPFLPPATCEARIKEAYFPDGFWKGVFCIGLTANNGGVCKGDSGGPVIYTKENILVGIISSGRPDYVGGQYR